MVNLEIPRTSQIWLAEMQAVRNGSQPYDLSIGKFLMLWIGLRFIVFVDLKKNIVTRLGGYLAWLS